MASGGGDTWFADMAREELEMLEAQHPDRFGYLKLELKSLISHPNVCSDLFYCINRDSHDFGAPDPLPADHDVATQVSSNRKRKVMEWNDELQQRERKTGRHSSVAGGDGGCRVDMAIKKAEACLKRIQLVKQSFFC